MIGDIRNSERKKQYELLFVSFGLIAMGFIIGAIFVSNDRDKLISKNQSTITGDCIVTNVTNNCNAATCEQHYGTIHYRLMAGNNTYYTEVSWRDRNIPVVGAKKQCWYYDNGIIFEDPRNEINKRSSIIIVLSTSGGILFVVALLFYCRSWKQSESLSPPLSQPSSTLRDNP